MKKSLNYVDKKSNGFTVAAGTMIESSLNYEKNLPLLRRKRHAHTVRHNQSRKSP
jgi:hypothetical protein